MPNTLRFSPFSVFFVFACQTLPLFGLQKILTQSEAILYPEVRAKLKERKSSSSGGAGDPAVTPKQNKQKRKRLGEDSEEVNDGKMSDDELMTHVYDNIVQAKNASYGFLFDLSGFLSPHLAGSFVGF